MCASAAHLILASYCRMPTGNEGYGGGGGGGGDCNDDDDDDDDDEGGRV